MSQQISRNALLPGRSKVVIFYFALILATLFWLAPVITLILTALKDAGDFAVNGAFSLPKFIRWENFSEAWETGVKNYFWNSVISARSRWRSSRRHESTVVPGLKSSTGSLCL